METCCRKPKQRHEPTRWTSSQHNRTEQNREIAGKEKKSDEEKTKEMTGSRQRTLIPNMKVMMRESDRKV